MGICNQPQLDAERNRQVVPGLVPELISPINSG